MAAWRSLLGCDLRIAADSAVFGIPAARLGISYGHADIKRLVDLVGPSNAKLIFSLPIRASPPTAPTTWAWSTSWCAANRLEARVHELAAQIAESAPSSVRWAKSAIEHVLKDRGWSASRIQTSWRPSSLAARTSKKA